MESETEIIESETIESNTEYCVMVPKFPYEPHRGPWNREDCIEWIREAIEEDGFPVDFFYVAKRHVGPWIRETYGLEKLNGN
jgi:hypothetical protein